MGALGLAPDRMVDAPVASVGILYRVVHRDIRCRRLSDDEAVVFLPGSGDTHLINSFAAEVLVQLQAAPGGLTADGLCGVLPPAAVDNARQLAVAVDAVLREFERVALVERVQT